MGMWHGRRRACNDSQARASRCGSLRCGTARSRHSQPCARDSRQRGGSPRVDTTNGFERVEAESLLIALDLEGIAVSTGSACSSGTLEPSHVLRAMGFPAHRTQNSLRFSLGMFSTDADVDRVVAVLPALVEKLRGLTQKTRTASR
jgi:cysteine sulfinate desulfinase/cysteine desulfurase-like protein